MSTSCPPRRRRPPAPPPEVYNLALTTHPGYAAFHKYEHYDEVLAKIERVAARGWPSHRGLLKNFVEHMDVLTAAREYLAALPPERRPLTPASLALRLKVDKFDHFDYIKRFIDMHPQGWVRAELMVQLALHRQGLSKGYLLLLAREPWERKAPTYPPVQRRLQRHSAQVSPHAMRETLVRARTRLRLIEEEAARSPPRITTPPSPRSRLAFELRAGIAALEKQISMLEGGWDVQALSEREWLLLRERLAEEAPPAPPEKEWVPAREVRPPATVVAPARETMWRASEETQVSRGSEEKQSWRGSEEKQRLCGAEEKRVGGGLLARAKRWSCF